MWMTMEDAYIKEMGADTYMTKETIKYDRAVQVAYEWLMYELCVDKALERAERHDLVGKFTNNLNKKWLAAREIRKGVK